MDVILQLVSVMLIASASARPQDVSITADSYKLSFATADGISRDEAGRLKNAGTGDEEWSVEGEYSWVDPDGKLHRVRYTADKNGYNAEEVPDVPDLVLTPFAGPGLSVKAALAG